MKETGNEGWDTKERKRANDFEHVKQKQHKSNAHGESKSLNSQPTSFHKQHLYFNFLRLQRLCSLFMVKFDFRLANKSKISKNMERKKNLLWEKKNEYSCTAQFVYDTEFIYGNAIVVGCIEMRCFIVQHPLAFIRCNCKHFYQIFHSSIAMETLTRGERNMFASKRIRMKNGNHIQFEFTRDKVLVKYITHNGWAGRFFSLSVSLHSPSNCTDPLKYTC